MRILYFFVFFMLLLTSVASMKVQNLPSLKKWTAGLFTSAALLFSSTLPAYSLDEGLQLQLQILRQEQVEAQKVAAQAAEDNLISKELLYPDGKLIARGMVLLTPNQGNAEFDKTNFPLGLLKASEVDESLGNDQATMFLLAVGREGPPVAALKYKLNSLSFPFVFEVTSDQLIFPYTPDAWTKSPNSKDSVALTAILSLDESLATPSDSEWVGFAVSNPVLIAGTNGRTTAKVSVSSRIAKNLYTEQEIESLKSIDRALDRMNGLESKTTTKK